MSICLFYFKNRLLHTVLYWKLQLNSYSLLNNINIAGLVMANTCYSASEMPMFPKWKEKDFFFMIILLGGCLVFSTCFWLAISRYNKRSNIVTVGNGSLFTDFDTTSTFSLTERRSIFYVLMNGFRFHLVSHSYWEAIAQLAKQQGASSVIYRSKTSS